MEFLGCGIIEVTSSVVTQQCRTGVYKMQPQTSNNKPVFQHETRQEFLYHINKGNGFWMVTEFYLIAWNVLTVMHYKNLEPYITLYL